MRIFGPAHPRSEPGFDWIYGRLAAPLDKPLLVMKDAPTTQSTGQLLKQLADEKAETISQPLQEIASLDSSFCVATPSIRDAVSPPPSDPRLEVQG